MIKFAVKDGKVVEPEGTLYADCGVCGDEQPVRWMILALIELDLFAYICEACQKEAAK